MKPWWIALQFLTRLPVPQQEMPEPDQIGRSQLFYPFVGLLIGLLLMGLQVLIGGTAIWLQAVLLLTFWVGLSGALHLDGLADSADAWMGGLGDKERTLRIMKDPASGPVAVVVLVLVLLLKFAALATLLESGHTLLLLLAPWLGRLALPLLFLTTPYVRSAGLGAALAEHLPKHALTWVLLANGAAMLCFGWMGVLALLSATAVFIYLRHLMLRRLKGCTGDTAGALVELTECAVLLALTL